MNLLAPESLAELVAAQQPPCLSLYQPTHRHHPAGLPLGELRVLAWQTAEPEYQARLTTLVEEFEQARAKQLGSDDLGEMAAKAGGRVMVMPSRRMPTGTGIAAVFRY